MLFAETLLTPAPFRMLIGPNTEVTAGQLEAGFCDFYTALLTTKDMTRSWSLLRAAAPTMGILTAETLFAKCLNDFIRRHCSQKAFQARVEALLTEHRANFPELSLRNLRRALKAGLRRVDSLDRMRRRFLMIDRYPELSSAFGPLVLEETSLAPKLAFSQEALRSLKL